MPTLTIGGQMTKLNLKKIRRDAEESLNSPTYLEWQYPTKQEVIAMVDRILELEYRLESLEK